MPIFIHSDSFCSYTSDTNERVNAEESYHDRTDACTWIQVLFVIWWFTTILLGSLSWCTVREAKHILQLPRFTASFHQQPALLKALHCLLYTMSMYSTAACPAAFGSYNGWNDRGRNACYLGIHALLQPEFRKFLLCLFLFWPDSSQKPIIRPDNTFSSLRDCMIWDQGWVLNS